MTDDPGLFVLRCVEKTCNDGPLRDGEPGPRLATDGYLCRRHADRLEKHLAELPARRDLLRSVLGGQGGTRSSETRPTKGNPPVPLNIDAHDHLEHLQQTVVSWVQLVTQERGEVGPSLPPWPPMHWHPPLRLPPPATQTHTVGLDRLASYLTARIGWIVGQLWVDDLAEEMRDIARTADSLTAATLRWHRLPAPCPACGASELGRWDGAEQVQCASCGDAWDEDHYPRLVRVLATDPTFTLTAAQAAEHLGVPASTFRRWAADGRLRPLGTADGVARFLVSDVDNLKDSA